MTTFEAQGNLAELLNAVRALPANTVLLSMTATDDVLELHTHNSDMNFIADQFGKKPIREEYGNDFDIEYFMHGNVKVFKLIYKAAAPIRTGDSDSEKETT